MTAATSVSDASSGLCQLCHGSPTCRFLFQSLASHHFIYVFVSVQVYASAFRCHTGCYIHLWGLNCWGLHYCSHLELTHGRHMCNLVMAIGPHQECTKWLLPPLLWVGGSFCYSISCPPAIPTIWWGIQL